MSAGLAFRIAGQSLDAVDLADLYALKDALSAVAVFAEDNALPCGWLDAVGAQLHAELKRRGVAPRFAPSWGALHQ